MTGRRYALVLLADALVLGVTGPMVVPRGLIWIFCGVLAWAAATIWHRAS